MSNRIETIFTRGSDVLGEELHCQVDDKNHVSWQVVPKGEQGDAYFPTPEDAENFMNQNAKLLGFPNRLASGSDLPGMDREIMHKTGRIPRWVRFYKADSF